MQHCNLLRAFAIYDGIYMVRKDLNYTYLYSQRDDNDRIFLLRISIFIG